MYLQGVMAQINDLNEIRNHDTFHRNVFLYDFWKKLYFKLTFRRIMTLLRMYFCIVFGKVFPSNEMPVFNACSGRNDVILYVVFKSTIHNVQISNCTPLK